MLTEHGQVNCFRSWGRGYSIKFFIGRLRPEVQPFSVLYTIFDRNGTLSIDKIVPCSHTVEPRINKPLYNEGLAMMNDFLQPGQNYSKMYGTEPRFNEILIIRNTIHKRKRNIYLDITNKCQHVIEDEYQIKQTNNDKIYVYRSLKVARYSFPGSIPPKFEHKLRRHRQTFGKIATTVVLNKDDNLL